MSYLVEFIVN